MGSIYSNQVIKVHHHICTNINWNNGCRGTSWNNTQKVVPSTNDSSSMTLNEFLQWDGHSLFYCAWVVYMARNIEQLCTSVSCASEPSKPVPTSPTNGWSHCNCFYIVDRRGLPGFPSKDSIKEVSSPQIYAPAPRCR